MTNTDFIVREKSGVNYITLAPSHRPEKTRFGVIDAALLLGFLAAFVGLVFLLSK
ncbi:MAG TPA: hypothetical protein VIK53_16310 [Verrucomicrobiae bacterium]